jgi:hypothetical protein
MQANVQDTIDIQHLNLAYLQTHLKRLDLMLGVAVEYARQAGFDPDNEFQGLFISEAEIDRYLNLEPGSGFWGNFGPIRENETIKPILGHIQEHIAHLEETAAQHNVDLRLLRVKRLLGLGAEDLEILLIALAPAIDRRYERIYGYLQDDVTKRRPSVNLALNLLAASWPARAAMLERFADQAPLVAQQIIRLVHDNSDPHMVFSNYLLKIDEQIVRYLQGVASLPAPWQNFLSTGKDVQAPTGLILDDDAHARLFRDYGESVPIFYLHGQYGSGRRSIALALAQHYHLDFLMADLSTMQKAGQDLSLLKLFFREGRLRGAALHLIGWETVLDDDHDIPDWLWREILSYPFIVILSSTKEWEPRGTNRTRLIVRQELEVPEYDHRVQHWLRHLHNVELDIAELAYKFKLTGGQIRDAVYSAYDLAYGDGRDTPTLRDLYRASRSQSSRRLTSLAVKIKPRYSWKSIVLPPSRVQQLREICDQVQHAVTVYDGWGFQGRAAGTHGLSALFAGQSGTGKTMAAEIIANELGLELFKVDLSSVVSKYIGETEKNLAVIFDEATQSNAILFFDEADALFGKRSEVKDSHDRYANIETGYLLQRMEAYDGIAILASNLRQNLDEAFTRRLDFMIDFPFPEEDDRLRIWQVSFPEGAPLAEDVDLVEISNRYRMAGGNIRNAAMASAFLAAGEGTACIEMRHIMHAVWREHQKMGRLLEDEFSRRFIQY